MGEPDFHAGSGIRRGVYILNDGSYLDIRTTKGGLDCDEGDFVSMDITFKDGSSAFIK